MARDKTLAMAIDVLVAGGGSAGLAAAVSAARCGARTLLVERHGALGGMGTVALVHSFCGLYELADEAGLRWANPGFASEVATRLIELGGAVAPVRMGRVFVLPHQPAGFARLADEIVLETGNLEVLLHSEVIAVRDGGAEVEISTRGARRTVKPRALVDTTGDGTLAALAGAAFEQAPAEFLQRPAFIFGLHGVDAGTLDDDGRLRISVQIARAVASTELPAGALGTGLRATGRGGEAYVTIDLAGAADYDPTRAADIAALEAEGRALAWRLAEFLRRSVEGFAASAISAFPARVGIRESRRVVGRSRLETADLETGTRFPDAIARATWPMELRESNRGPRLRYPEHGRPADIPLGALRARDLDAFFVAGRCLSCSHEAQASIRVMGTCLATGEAAGIAAALHASGQSVDAAAVRSDRERIRKS